MKFSEFSTSARAKHALMYPHLWSTDELLALVLDIHREKGVSS